MSNSLATPWTVARQAPLSMGCSRQQYPSGLPSPPPGDLSDPGTEPASPACQANSLPLSLQGSPLQAHTSLQPEPRKQAGGCSSPSDVHARNTGSVEPVASRHMAMSRMLPWPLHSPAAATPSQVQPRPEGEPASQKASGETESLPAL